MSNIDLEFIDQIYAGLSASRDIRNMNWVVVANNMNRKFKLMFMTPEMCERLYYKNKDVIDPIISLMLLSN